MATYYVDQNHGSALDANAGTSESLPWLTMSRAMEASVVAGDTVYVKNGTYNAGTSPFLPANSGTSGANIAYRAYTPPSGARHIPLVTRTEGNDGVGHAVLSATGRDYIIWDGFELGPFTAAQILNGSAPRSTGNIFENLIIHPGATTIALSGQSCGQGNYSGVYLQLTSNTIVRNCTIYDVTYTDCPSSTSNAVGIVMFDNDNAHIHNNEIYDCNAGISDKENGESNIHELNYIHDIGTYGVQVQGFVTGRCGTCPVSGIIIRNNVFVSITDFGVYLNLSDVALDTNFDVYNNTFYDVRVGYVMAAALTGMNAYNNIFAINGVGNYGNFSLTTPPADWASDYNLFRALAGTVRFVYEGAGETLAQWQAHGAAYDANSLTSDPLFVGAPITGAAYYKLQAGSPAINAGHVGGVVGGAEVNIGAYATGSEIIGVAASVAASNPSSAYQSHRRRFGAKVMAFQW